MNQGVVFAGEEKHTLNYVDLTREIEALKKKVVRLETEVHILKESSRTYYEKEGSDLL